MNHSFMIMVLFYRVFYYNYYILSGVMILVVALVTTSRLGIYQVRHFAEGL